MWEHDFQSWFWRVPHFAWLCKDVFLLEHMSSHLSVKKKILLDVLVKVGQRVQNGWFHWFQHAKNRTWKIYVNLQLPQIWIHSHKAEASIFPAKETACQTLDFWQQIGRRFGRCSHMGTLGTWCEKMCLIFKLFSESLQTCFSLLCLVNHLGKWRFYNLL